MLPAGKDLSFILEWLLKFVTIKWFSLNDNLNIINGDRSDFGKFTGNFLLNRCV
jgi:hypothetical protein